MKQPNTSSIPSHADFEPWIGTTTACRHLGISALTLRRWIKSGRLKPKRTPTGEFRFRRSELDSLIG